MFDPVEAIKEFIRQPSVSTDSRYKDGMVGARKHVSGLLEGIGFDVEIIETPLHPLVFAQRKGPAEWPHVVIYGHYDVQPPDPESLWETPPFEPTLKDGRLYGRGAADNKGPMMIHIAAVARLLEKNPDAKIRISFLIEGEEEIGSPSFPDVLERYKDRLKGDFVLLSDTGCPSKEQLGITVGLRGMTTLQLEVTGPNSDIHSGLYGGAVYNPIQALTEICASLHDDKGMVNIPGFYDDVVEAHEWQKDEVNKLGNDSSILEKRLNVPDLIRIENFTPFQATRFLPTLEFNGIGGGYQGEGDKTIIPSRAFVKISCRLVANQDEKKMGKLVADAIKARAPKAVRISIKVGHDGPAYQVIPPDRVNTPKDQNPYLADAFRTMEKSITENFPFPPIYLCEGGSVPIIGLIKKKTGMDSLMLGVVTPDSKLHAPNESFDIEMFTKAIDVSEATLRGVAGLS